MNRQIGIGSVMIKRCIDCGTHHASILGSRLVSAVSQSGKLLKCEDYLYRDNFCECPAQRFELVGVQNHG